MIIRRHDHHTIKTAIDEPYGVSRGNKGEYSRLFTTSGARTDGACRHAAGSGDSDGGRLLD